MVKDKVSIQLEHIFRKESGKLVSILTRSFGASNIDLAETVVQEALLKAVQVWPYKGIPSNPSGWLMQVAKNKAIDLIRKDRHIYVDQSVLDRIPDESQFEESFENELIDNQLRLMFICCHPVLSHEARVGLTLKTVCGFGVSEIARAFLVKEETIFQRIVRAKQKIRDENLKFEFPSKSDLTERLEGVLDTIYLLFNEGYSKSFGADLINDDLCYEALRLIEILSKHAVTQSPKVYALAALLSFQASRLSTRVDQYGDVLILSEQERSSWDHKLIERGLVQLSSAATGESLSRFHLYAGIAACHATAENFEQTDWNQIKYYYEQLTELYPSPINSLNKAVAVSFVDGPESAIKALKKLEKENKLFGYYLLPAAIADCYRRTNELQKAIEYYNKALKTVGNLPEKNFLLRRINECNSLLNKSLVSGSVH